jgi:mono/diheme cytochrome c family protein
MIHMYRIKSAVILIILIVSVAGCDRNNNHPGYDYFPDMTYSKAYETNSANPVLKNHSTMLEPVKGTISREQAVFPYEKNDSDRVRAGKELINPFDSVSMDLLNQGKRVYETFCIVCHGEKGDGKGNLYTSGKYPFPPAHLNSDKVKKLLDGEIYHTITVGFGVMGAHGSQIRPEDRWKVILYIRNVLQK